MPAPRVPLEVHLDPLTPAERALWERYAALVATVGPSEMIVNKSRIAFKAPHRNFTGGFFKSRRLELFFDLPEPGAGERPRRPLPIGLGALPHDLGSSVEDRARRGT